MASINPSHSAMSLGSPGAPDRKFSSGNRAGAAKNQLVVDLLLRFIVFVAALVGIIVMLTSKQTEPVTVAPGLAIPLAAKFNQFPAFIFHLSALSVTCLYTIITGLLSILALSKGSGRSTKTLSRILILDILFLGMLASAIGASGEVGYIAYKGNSHTRWNKVCHTFDTFCLHAAGTVAVTNVAITALLILIWVSIFALSKKASRT